jgi:glycosyltransferase involved in cell wall biosynthesis
LNEINPHLQRLSPSLVIDVTGNNPPDELVALAPSNIRFVGEIDDFSEYLGRARATIAPIRYGAGVKLKVVDSLARGVPVVGTSIGLEGLGSQWGVGTVCEDDPVRFAEAIARICGDEDVWRAMSDDLAKVCRSHHNDPLEQWRDILATTVTTLRSKETDG